MVWYDNWPVWHKYDIFLIHNVIPRRGSLSKSVSKSKNFWFEELTLAKGPRFKKLSNLNRFNGFWAKKTLGPCKRVFLDLGHFSRMAWEIRYKVVKFFLLIFKIQMWLLIFSNIMIFYDISIYINIWHFWRYEVKI